MNNATYEECKDACQAGQYTFCRWVKNTLCDANGVCDGPNAVTIENCGRPIPTLTEWGLIIFTLLGISFGAIFIRRRQTVFAGAGDGNSQFTERTGSTLFAFPLYIKVLAVMLTVAAVGFAVATWWLGSVSMVDVCGTLTCAVISAYLVHLWILSKRESKEKPE